MKYYFITVEKFTKNIWSFICDQSINN